MISQTQTNDAAVFHNRFQHLNTFNQAKEQLKTVSKEDHLKSLGRIICDHRFEDYVGVSLLHRHFDINAGEVIVKRFHGRRASIKPESWGLADHLIPYLWRIQSDGLGRPQAESLEFLFADSARSKYAAKAESVAENRAFLEAMYSYLNQHGIEDVFGIGLIHNEIPVHANELLMETTNERHRTLTIRPYHSDRISSDVSETYWAFHRDSDSVNQVCMWHCKGHRAAEPKMVCLGHCWSCR